MPKIFHPITNTSTQSIPPLSTQISWVLAIIFLAVTFFLLLLGQTPAWRPMIGALSINFLAMMIEALPFMLLGSLVGGLIEVFVPLHWFEQRLASRPSLAVFSAASMGLIFPVCECAIVPVVRRLLAKGLPLGAAISFLLGGPIVNSLVAASTAIAYAYDWRVVLLRLGCGYAVAVATGLLLGRFFDTRQALEDYQKHFSSDHSPPAAMLPMYQQPLISKLQQALRHAQDDFFAIGFYLVIGAFIAAFVRSTVSLDAFLHLQQQPWQGIALMMGMALALNLCSEADAFIAAGFRGLLPLSAQLAFLVLGPMLDLKLLCMYFGVFRPKMIIAFASVVISLVLALMLLVQAYYPQLS